MKLASSILGVVLLVQDPACDHGTGGATRPLDLAAVARFHAEAARAFGSITLDKMERPSWPPFDSGLPACRRRETRRVTVEPLPPELPPLYFAPAGAAAPDGALLVSTRARSMADLAIPADAELVARFGVRCVPTLVRPTSEHEVELREGERP